MTAVPTTLDRLLHAGQARVTGGVSPTSLTLAFLDWAVHLAGSPGVQQRLMDKALRQTGRLAAHAAEYRRDPHAPACIRPLPQDHRFDDPMWRTPPFDLLVQAFLLSQQWWHNATTGIEGASRHHEEVVAFCARQMLDVWSPSNFLLTNPEVLTRTVHEGGTNLVRGARNLFEDWLRAVAGEPSVGTEAYPVGEVVAVTSGAVVFRNRLIEVIQYRPATEAVHPEPGELWMDPDTWQRATPAEPGSWWPVWQEWLAEHSAPPAAPPSLGAPAAGYPVVGEAPGEYVHET